MKERGELGHEAAKQLDEKVWLDESHGLCEEFAYDAEVTGHLRSYATEPEAPPIRLSERYLKIGGTQSERQAVMAGYRLGHSLKSKMD